MKRFAAFICLTLLMLAGGPVLRAGESDISITEFRQLYDSLLAGKTLVTETREDGLNVTTSRQFGQAINVGDNDFEVPITTVVTKAKDGQTIQTVKVSIIDRVNDIGGQPIIYEEARRMVVENPEAAPLNTNEVEFMGLFRVSKNDKGGFDVHNFGLIPSVVVEDNKNKISGSNLSYSCFSENALSKCVLTVRDYKLGDYTPLVGYELLEPVGSDLVMTAVESDQQ